MNETLKIWNTSGQHADMYGFKMDEYTMLDGVTAAPTNTRANEKLANSISKSFTPNRSVLAFTGSDNTVIRLVGKDYYIQLTISNKILGSSLNQTETVKEFYSAAVKHLQEKKKVATNTHADISQITVDAPAA